MEHAKARRQRQSAPGALIVHPENIPPAIRNVPFWLVWRYEPPADGKWAKPPYDPRTKGPADPTDPAACGTFAEAIAAYRGGGFDGIGFILTAEDPFTALDLDKCRDIHTGVVEEWALQLIARLSSYTEVTPSGAGARILVLGKKPGTKCRRGRLEVYDRARYVTITGHHLAGTPEGIESRQEELAAVLSRAPGCWRSCPGTRDPSRLLD
jgi:primase-polymerase (primpol)-like protein